VMLNFAYQERIYYNTWRDRLPEVQSATTRAGRSRPGGRIVKTE